MRVRREDPEASRANVPARQVPRDSRRLVDIIWVVVTEDAERPTQGQRERTSAGAGSEQGTGQGIETVSVYGQLP